MHEESFGASRTKGKTACGSVTFRITFFPNLSQNFSLANFRFPFNVVFPESENRPTVSSQKTRNLPVPLHVGFYLITPEFFCGFFSFIVLVTVPEVAITVNDDFFSI